MRRDKWISGGRPFLLHKSILLIVLKLFGGGKGVTRANRVICIVDETRIAQMLPQSFP